MSERECIGVIHPVDFSEMPGVADVLRNAFTGEAAEIIRMASGLLSLPPSSSVECWGIFDDGVLRGFIGLSPAELSQPTNLRVFILAPLAVHPERQGRGYGRQLVKHAIASLQSQGVDTLLVYGDPVLYQRFGFEAAGAERFVPPYPLEFSFGWQVNTLSAKAMPVKPIRFRCVAALDDPCYW